MVESIKELKKICDKGEKEHWYLTRILRPISIYPTKVFLKWHISANQVTFFDMFVSTIGAIFFIIGGYVNAIVAALLFNVWLLFDLVDGQIARYHGNSSPAGTVLDSINADISYALLFISAGIGVYNMPFNGQFFFSMPIYSFLHSFDPAIFIVFGAIGSLSKILDRHIENKLSVLFNAKINPDVKALRNEITSIGRLRKAAARMEFNLFNQGGLLLLLVLVAAVFDLLPLWVIFSGVCLPLLFIVRMTIRLRSYL